MRDATTHAGTGVGIPAAADAGRQPQRGVPQHPAEGRSPLAIEATDTGQRHDPHRRRFTGTPSNLGSTPPAIIGGQA